MHKKKIIPIVLHKVVESKCIDFEDITVATLRKILKKDPDSYITIDDEITSSSKKFMYMITFDDGHVSDYKIVFPLLKSLDIRATFFINTNSIGKPGFLTWDMINEMRNNGNVFGSHGHNHLKMPNISEEACRYEFLKSKEIYEFHTGDIMKFFSFPYGSYNKDLLELAVECHYKNCFISKHGVIQKIGNVIPRNSINSSMDEIEIAKILNPTFFIILNWIIEDTTKNFIKNVIGDKYYRRLRKNILNILN